MPIQKGVGFNVATKKMTMDAQATVEDVKQKLMKTNTKYKEVVDRNHRDKVFKEGDKVMMFLCKERFPGGSYVIDLHDNMSIFRTFNVSDIYPF
jgi:hypothetical protein